jgi:choice-of-anchor B domain-containing protein
MLRLLFFTLLPLTTLSGQNNLQRLAHIPMDSVTLAGCYHYTDSSGREYALVGHSKGMSIFNLDNPAAPQQLFSVPGLINNWRELRTWAGFAYVGSEAIGSGITIVDLRHLPDSIHYKTWLGDGDFAGKVQKSHTVQTRDGYLYIFGANNDITQGAIIADLSDPWNPHIIGKYADAYVHDGYIRGDTLWTSEIYQGQFGVVDISDRSQPLLITTHPTPFAFNHNSELSPDSRTLFTTDEKQYAPVAAFDVSNLSNIQLLDTYVPSRKPAGEVHNVRVKGNFLICPSYKGQLTLVDATHPDNLIEIAWDSLGNSLVWDADGYLPSGIIFATAKNEGLYVYQPTYQQAAYLEGHVWDASNGLPIGKAHISIPALSLSDSTRNNGQYKTGHIQSGQYQVWASAPGYQPVTADQVVLNNGQITQQDFWLVPTTTAAGAPATDGQAVWPTVFRETLHLRLPRAARWQARLTNMQGYTLANTVFDAGGTVAWHLPAGIPPGGYVLQLVSGNEVKVARVYAAP